MCDRIFVCVLRGVEAGFGRAQLLRVRIISIRWRKSVIFPTTTARSTRNPGAHIGSTPSNIVGAVGEHWHTAAEAAVKQRHGAVRNGDKRIEPWPTMTREPSEMATYQALKLSRRTCWPKFSYFTFAQIQFLRQFQLEEDLGNSPDLVSGQVQLFQRSQLTSAWPKFCYFTDFAQIQFLQEIQTGEVLGYSLQSIM